MNTVISPMKIVNDLIELSNSTVLIKSNFRNGASFAFSRAILEFFTSKIRFQAPSCVSHWESLSRAKGKTRFVMGIKSVTHSFIILPHQLKER